MDPLKTRLLLRKDIGEFIGSPRGVRAFEEVQGDVANQYEALSTGTFLTLTDAPSLGEERVLRPVAGELAGTDGGTGVGYTLGLADTTVVAGIYGAATKTVRVTVDGKGRLTGVTEYTLNTDNVAEGATNLYFTTARARAAVSGTTGISYTPGSGIIALDTASTRNTDHASVSVSAGAGLTGGGDLTASRTLALGATGVTPGTYASPTSITVDAYGRITAIS